jgi:HlyD family secretion protein
MKKATLALNGTLAVAVVGLGLFGYTRLGSASAASGTESTATVRAGNVVSSVSATGNVESASTSELSFGSSGKVTAVNVKVGDTVTAGQALATIDDTSAKQQLASAQATLEGAQASLDKLKTGLSGEERAQMDAQLQQSQASIDQAKTAVDNARANALADAGSQQLNVNQASASVDTATNQLHKDQTTLLENQSALQTTQASADPNRPVGESLNAVLIRFQADQDSCQANTKTDGFAPPDGVACSAVSELMRLAQAVQSADQKVTQDQSSVNQASNQLANATNNQTTAALKNQQSITSAENQLKSAMLSYQATQAGNAVKLEPASAADVAQGQAQVTSAQTQVDDAQKAVDETTLVAPIDATVTAVNGAVGDQVGSGSNSSGGNSNSGTGNTASSSGSNSSSAAFIALTSMSSLQVTAGFSEADAAKVKVGQTASLTLDALETTVTGKVVEVSPLSTTSNNVVTYPVTISLDTTDQPVRPGMTTTVTVTVDERQNVLTLPTSAVTGRGSTARVMVRGADGKLQAQAVQIGLRGDSTVEITSGLNEGDQVVVQRTTTTGASATNTRTGFGGAGITGGGPAGGFGGAPTGGPRGGG